MMEGIEDMEMLELLSASLDHKGGWPGTKVQIKPMFRRRNPEEMHDDSFPTNPLAVSPQAAVDVLTPHEHNKLPDDRESLLVQSQTQSNSLSGPTFSQFSAVDNNLILDKLQLVIKWGGEPTHAARYQSQDIGLNMRDNLELMNKEALNDVRIFTSSKRRVSTSGKPLILKIAATGFPVLI
jgi:hypothetical protein